MEQYIGHQSDVQRAQDQPDCGGPRAQLIQLEAGKEPWFLADGRISIPSDSKDVDGTLIRFVYEIGLRKAPSGYEMIFSYDAAPVSEKFHGDIAAIKVLSNSPTVRAAIAETGHKEGIINLRKYSDRIEIPMKLKEPFQRSQQRYVFHDVRGEIVGEIEAPFLSIDGQ
ncbi:hypothetical protein [Bradyrhizobium sp. 30]|uniref:hypothetical protein n=1 Tax=Bradyrhizobium sp. 30 TaxID=2782669 RepID=UPI001FF97B6D|nr:hypothetical protein [Bradyrhizobium sp. 30]MCK1290330.1 hypothetical protein [Bradyrhizobium sp. 30]